MTNDDELRADQADEPTEERAPRADLYRAMAGGVTSADGRTLTIRLAPHDQWAEISSVTEGHFMERFSRTAYRKTMAEHPPKILFQHGKDPAIGEKPIATTDEVGEDETSPYARGQLLDGLPELVVDGLRKGVYGASHRFSVVREKWDDNPVGGPHNPDRLPERTITEARLFELGPVTWPAYAQASASLRSLTDEMRPPTPAPVAPSLDAAAPEPHLEPERRDEPDLPPVAAVVSPPVPKESPVSEYRSPGDKEARVAELKSEITRLAEEFTGVMPIEQQARWDADKAELAALEADLAAYNERAAFVRTISASTDHGAPAPATFNVVKTRTTEDIYSPDQFNGTRYRTVEERNQTLRDNAMRSIETSYLPQSATTDNLARFLDTRDRPAEDASPEFAGQPEIASRILLTGNPVYKRAFAKYLRHGNTDMFTPEEQRAAALTVVGTTTTGGYAVPYVFDPTIIHIGAFTAINPYRQACRVETISGGNNWKTVTVGAVTSTYIAESNAATEQGPTFGQPDFTVYRAHAFATVSIETLMDRPDITEELTSVFAESKATYEENQFTLGVGTTVFPLGMFVDTAYTNQDTATNDTTAIADLQALEGALPLRFRANGAFFMNRKTIRQLQALDTTYRYFTGAGIQYPGNPSPAQPPTTGNTGLQCLGYPVWEVPSAVSTLTTDGAIIVVFTDPKSYVIVDRIGMNVEVIPNMLNGATPSFPTGQRGIYCYWRNTARPLAADMGRSLSVQ